MSNRVTHKTEITPTLKNFEGGGVADYKCNKCGKVVERDLGMRTWVKSLCGETGEYTRLYRISGIKPGK